MGDGLPIVKRHPSKLLHGTWEYTAVLRNDTTLFPVKNDDTMVLRPNKTFQYDISFINKHSIGIWSLDDRKSLITLTYLPDNKKRNFQILFLTSDSLAITENGVVFEYRKKMP